MSEQPVKTAKTRAVVAIGACASSVTTVTFVQGLIRYESDAFAWFTTILCGAMTIYMWAWALRPSKPGESTPCVRS